MLCMVRSVSIKLDFLFYISSNNIVIVYNMSYNQLLIMACIPKIMGHNVGFWFTDSNKEILKEYRLGKQRKKSYSFKGVFTSLINRICVFHDIYT